MLTILLFLSLAAFSFKLWKVSKTKKNLNKQIEKLQLELEQKKSNQKNDESYDSLDEDDQQGHNHHRQKITTMAKKKKHSLEKPQLHLQEEAIKNSQLKMPNKVKEDEISSNFYNYSIAETNYVNYQN